MLSKVIYKGFVVCIACLVAGPRSPVLRPARGLNPDVSDDACTRAATRDVSSKHCKALLVQDSSSKFSPIKIPQHPRLFFFLFLPKKHSDLCFDRMLVRLSGGMYLCTNHACYFGRSSGPVDVNSNELMGDIGKVNGRDVVIVDELIDTGGTLGVLPRKLRDAGAKVSCYARDALWNRARWGGGVPLFEAL